jgi:hypothetical protein
MTGGVMRTIVGVVVGFVAWLFGWMGWEMVLSAIWPEWFGAHQRAFQAAITNGAPFTPDTTILLIHIVSGSLNATLSGLVAARIAGEYRRTPVVMGVVLLALGLMKAMLSWSLVPIWYHVAFSVLLFVMAALGGRAAARRV